MLYGTRYVTPSPPARYCLRQKAFERGATRWWCSPYAIDATPSLRFESPDRRERTREILELLGGARLADV